MNLGTINEEKCGIVEREIVEGLCLSYDMIRDLCLETMKPCTAMSRQEGKQQASHD